MISRTFAFEAAHRLTQVPPEHKCFRMHGHSFKAEVFVRRIQRNGAYLDAAGMELDYDHLKTLWQALVDDKGRHLLDHNCLNDVPGLENPTSEEIARWIFNRFLASFTTGHFGPVTVERVTVRETEHSSATFP